MQTLNFTHQNEGASRPLVLPYNIVCNTPDDVILSNVLTNSRRIKKWAKTLPAHDGVAVICGSSPSAIDYVEQIASLQESGAKVFALNAAADFLNSKLILPDYQVVMDAQLHTVDLIGHAQEYLFASQVHPLCFDKVPDAILWHSTHGDTMVDEQDGFPAHDDDYCLIGSSASVGNTTLVLAYALGYRKIRIFGMDSSHRGGQSHVAHQACNDGDPCLMVNFDGKEYLCSFTMKMQADNFMQRASALQKDGCDIQVYGDGYLPTIWNAPVEAMTEQRKYERMYDLQAYREFSPGERIADKFLDWLQPHGTVIDFGCGTGRASAKIKAAGCEVISLDFASNSVDTLLREQLDFRQADLREPLDCKGDFGFCTDVMEHIEPQHVDTVINNIMASVPKCFFQICLVEDDMGEMIRTQLHLSVHSHYWWVECFKRLGYTVEWFEKGGINSLFIISST